MQIQPITSYPANSFKSISTIRIPKQNGSSQKLVVKVNHDGDFYNLHWRQVIIETLEKGKVITKNVIGNKNTIIPAPCTFMIMDIIDNMVGTSDEDKGNGRVALFEKFDEQKGCHETVNEG